MEGDSDFTASEAGFTDENFPAISGEILSTDNAAANEFILAFEKKFNDFELTSDQGYNIEK